MSDPGLLRRRGGCSASHPLKCQKLDLPPGKYDLWKNTTFRFNPVRILRMSPRRALVGFVIVATGLPVLAAGAQQQVPVPAHDLCVANGIIVAGHYTVAPLDERRTRPGEAAARGLLVLESAESGPIPVVEIKVELLPDGTVSSAQVVDSDRMQTDPAFHRRSRGSASRCPQMQPAETAAGQISFLEIDCFSLRPIRHRRMKSMEFNRHHEPQGGGGMMERARAWRRLASVAMLLVLAACASGPSKTSPTASSSSNTVQLSSKLPAGTGVT